MSNDEYLTEEEVEIRLNMFLSNFNSDLEYIYSRARLWKAMAIVFLFANIALAALLVAAVWGLLQCT